MQEKNKDKKKKLLILFLLVFGVFFSLNIIWTNIRKEKNETPADITDTYKKNIKEYIGYLYKNGKQDKVKKILTEIGIDDNKIETIIDSQEKVINIIVEEIDNDEKKYEQVIDTIKEIIKESDEDTSSSKDDDKTSNDSDNTGSAIISTNKNLNMVFENLIVESGSVQSPKPEIVNDTLLNFNVVLDKPNDYYSFTVDIKNNSSIDAKIDNFNSTVLTIEEANVLDFLCIYNDGTPIRKGDVIKTGETKKIKFIISYKDINTVENLPKSDLKANYHCQITFVQAN